MFSSPAEGARGGGGSKKKNEVLTDLPCTKQAEADVDVVFGRMSGYGNGSRSFPLNENELGTYCKCVQCIVVLSYFEKYRLTPFSTINQRPA